MDEKEIKKMTLDEAIEHSEKVANGYFELLAESETESAEYVQYHKQLADLRDYELDDLQQKSDAELVTELLRSKGYEVSDTADGLEVSKDGLTVGCVLKPDPDEDGRTDCFFFSSDRNTDGWLANFEEGCPEDEAYEITRCLEGAFKDEKLFQAGDFIDDNEDIIKKHDAGRMPEDFWYIDRIREAVKD